MKRALLLIAFLVFTIAACMVSCTLVDRVMPSAEAETVTLPDDGVVGDNLLFNSDFTNSLQSSVSYESNLPLGNFGYLNGTGVLSDYLTVTTSVTYSGIGQLFDSLPLGTYTLSLRYSSLSSLIFGIRASNGTSFSTINRSAFLVSSDLTVSSITSNLSTSYQRYDIFVWLVASGSFSVDWIKLEQGDQFTGYVPNYEEIENQGFTEGAQERPLNAREWPKKTSVW